MAAIYECGEELVPGYRVVKCLGRGGFGTVYKALGPGGFYVALKVINLFGANEGRKELRALNLIKNVAHANLVRIMGAWVKDRSGLVLDDLDRVAVGAQSRGAPRTSLADTAVFTQQFRPSELIICMTLGDRSLHDCLEVRQREGHAGVPVEELFEYMEGAARGIDFLNREIHDLGDGRLVAIQHCDIKPMNILIVGGDSVQVCDFGMAKVVGDLRQSTGGAPLYMAPEVIQNREPSRSTDQYSLAITYYELRTGGWPFDHQTQESREGILQAHLQGKLDFSLLEPGEGKVIAKATALDAAQRFSSCLEMVRALRESHHQSSKAPLPPQPQSTGREEPGEQFVPGYWLAERIDFGDCERVWRATFNEDSNAALLVRDLPQSPNAFDRNALKLVLNRRSGYQLTVPNQYWLLGADGHEIRRSGSQRSSDALKSSAAPAALPTKLVVAGSLGDGTLQDRLNAGDGPFSPDVLLPWMEQIARALDHLNSPRHQFGSRKVTLLHCNIRPPSILCVEDGSDVLLGNFTRARILEDAGDLRDISQDFPGPYAAPELRDGRLERSSDQYSLAVTYLQLRTGQVKLDPALTSYELLDFAHDHISAAESDVLARALAFDPQERYPQCAGLVYALQAALFPPVERPQPIGPVEPSTGGPGPKETARGSDTPPDFNALPEDDEILLISASQKYAPGDQPIRGFRLVKLLGEGGFGEVWKATAPGGTEVALKFIKLDGKKGLKEFGSLRLVKLVRHPNLVPIVAYWLTDQRGAVLEASADIEDEILSGGSHSEVHQTLEATPRAGQPLPVRLIIAMGLGDSSLFDRLEECRDAGKMGIPREELMRYMDGAAQAIDFLNSAQHDLGTGPVAIQHCDIKPHNLLIVGGAVQVCDFGLARSLTNARVTADATCSAPYAPPEIWRGENPHPQTDQYSLAISYFELRTGGLPFPSENHAMVMYSHLEGKLDLSKLPEPEQKIIARATSLAPDDRYENCHTMVAALNEIYQPKPKPQKASGRWAAVAAMLLVLVGFVVWRTLPARNVPPQAVEEIKQLETLLAARKYPELAARCTEFQNQWGERATELLLPVHDAWVGHADDKFNQWNQQLGKPRRQLALEAVEICERALSVPAFSEDPRLTELRDLSAQVVPFVRSLEEAESLLTKNYDSPQEGTKGYESSLGLFRQLQADSELPDEFRARVVLGSARAAARLGSWDIVREHLQDSVLGQLQQPKQIALVSALRACHAAAEIQPDLAPAEKLRLLIAGLQPLIVPADGPAGRSKDLLRDLNPLDWELGQAESLRKRATAEVLQVLGERQADFDLEQRKARSNRDLDLLEGVAAVVPGEATNLNVQTLGLQKLQGVYQEVEQVIRPSAQGAAATDSEARIAAVTALAARIERGDVLPADCVFVCDTLARHARQSAGSDQAALDAILRLLYDARTRDPAIAGAFESLLHDKLQWLLDQTDDPAARAQFASQCQQAIEAGIADPLLKCCWAECLLEWPPDQLKDAPVSLRVDQANAEMPLQPPPGFEPYWHYVRARLLSQDPARRDWTAIAGELQSFTGGPDVNLPVVPLTPLRRERLGELAYQTVANLWFSSDKAPASIEQAVVNPYGLAADPAAAADASKWLQIASQWAPKVPSTPEFGMYAVLAAASSGAGGSPLADSFGNPRDWPVTDLNYKNIAVRYAHAKSLESAPDEKSAALRLHVALAHDLLNAGISKEVDQTQAYEHVFEHAIAFGQQSYQAAPSPELAETLAELHAAKGQFLWDRRFDTWQIDVFGQIAAAYDQAIRLVAENSQQRANNIPTYIFRWGQALLGAPNAEALQPPKLNEIIQRAKQAIALHQASGGEGAFVLGNGLIGQANRLLADLQPNLNLRAGLLDGAITELKIATSTPPDTDTEDTAWNLMNLVQAHINLVHILPYEVERHAAHLHEAVAAAQRAVACSKLYPEYAYRSLGNAQEDTAWFVGFVKRDESARYQQAIEAFTVAHERNSLLSSQALCARGRCYFKRYAFSGRTDKSDLENAKSDLTEASEHAIFPSAEAAYWLGQINGLPAAESLVKQALDNAAGGDYVTYLDEWARLPLRQAEAALLKPENAATREQIITRAVAESRARGGNLGEQRRFPGSLEDPRVLANLLEADISRLQGKWEDERLRYDSALGKTPREQLDGASRKLLLRRCNLLVERKPAGWEEVALADARRLVELQPYPWDRASALGLLAQVEYQSKQHGPAIEHYREFMRLVPAGADGSLMNTEYAGWRARYFLSFLLVREILTAKLPQAKKQELYREAYQMYQEAQRSGTIPETEKPQFQGLTQAFARLHTQLFPPAQPPAGAAPAGK